MIPELIGAVGLVFAAVITGIFHRMRRENDAAHGESIAKLEDNGRTTARSTRPQVPFCATGRAPPTKPSAEHFRAPDPLHHASYVVRDSDVTGRHCRVAHDYQWRAGAGAAERSLLLREYEVSSLRFGGVRSVDVSLPPGHLLLIKDFLAAVGRDG